MAFSVTSLPGHRNLKLLEDYSNLSKHGSATHRGEIVRSQRPITTGTSVLGVKYDNGVVLAGDMLGSYGSLARYANISRSIEVNSSTVIFASGDYADYQYIQRELDIMEIENDIQDDGHKTTPQSIFSYLRLLMYERRNKFNPLWNTLAIGGLNDGKPFLGYIDKLGTAYQDDSIATGYGAYIARPLIAKALEEKKTLTKAEAVKLMIECLKVLFYRDARSINKFEIAVISEDGVTIEKNITSETNWDIAAYVIN